MGGGGVQICEGESISASRFGPGESKSAVTPAWSSTQGNNVTEKGVGSTKASLIKYIKAKKNESGNILL